MIVNDRWTFVHNPKSGGQSVTAALGGKTLTCATHAPRFAVDGGRFAFGFARNPWGRMVSLYRYLCQKPHRASRDGFDQDEVRRVGFKAWLTEGRFFMGEDAPWRSEALPPMQRRPQLWWLDGCDFIGRFEAIADDFRAACETAGIGPAALPHVNGTTGGDWRAAYDGESVAFVAEHFAPDIRRFGYGFR